MGSTVYAYITKSAHSNRYFLNMASPVMEEKRLIADVSKENSTWKGQYYYGEPSPMTVTLEKDNEYFALLNELFSDAETLLSHSKKSLLVPIILFIITSILGLITLFFLAKP